MWAKDLETYEEVEVPWRCSGLIKEKGIVVLGGKRSTLKSWFALILSHAVARGENFLGKFLCNKGNVLYLDRENGFSELKKRCRLIKNGLQLEDSSNILFLSESYVKIDNQIDVRKLEEIILANQIKLLIVDVYRRAIGFDENDAKEVSRLFVDILKPLSERTGISILLLHHERKGESQGDDMDMLRGSSDLANYVDGIIQLERRGNNLIVKQTKSRAGKEIEPFNVCIKTDELDYFRLEYKGEMETREKQISKTLTQWIIDNKKSSFTYTEAWKYAQIVGYKETNFKNALRDLQSSGLISKPGDYKSPYQVSKDLKLGGYDE
jgi:hypothetical protein